MCHHGAPKMVEQAKYDHLSKAYERLEAERDKHKAAADEAYMIGFSYHKASADATIRGYLDRAETAESRIAELEAERDGLHQQRADLTHMVGDLLSFGAKPLLHEDWYIVREAKAWLKKHWGETFSCKLCAYTAHHLELENDSVTVRHHVLSEDRAEALQAQVGQLTAALRFYAAKSAYGGSKYECPSTGLVVTEHPEVLEDGGQRALAALTGGDK